MALQTPSSNSSAYLRCSFVAIATYPFTIYCRAQTEQNTAAQPAFYFGLISADDDSHTLYFRGDVAGDPIGFRCTGPSFAGANVNSVAGYSVNTWVDICGVAASASDRRLYANNVKSTSTATVGFQGGELAIGAYGTVTAITEYLSGRVSNCAVWDVALTDDEVTSLYRGFSPRRIRPQSLKFYAPLVRDFNDIRGGVTLTQSGSLSVAEHPRTYGL